MTKQQLIEMLHQSNNISKQNAKAAVTIFFDCIANSLASAQRIEVRGFGSFKLKRYKGYEGRNPRTGKILKVNAKRLPAFKPAKMLKLRVDSLRRTAPAATAAFQPAMQRQSSSAAAGELR